MSDVAVIMAQERRDVKLRDGEAWFQVAHDRDRPFIVEAGPVRVQAVGTAFSVRRRTDGADVLVTEGVVETWVEGRENTRTRIEAGSRSFVANNAQLIKVQPSGGSIDRSLAWRTGELVLNGESLAYAVEELNRYNARKIVIDSPSLRRETVIGYFRIDQLDSFAQAISVTMGATVHSNPDEIHLSR
ncbi:Anti-sigma [Novosphingobium resinovorum]|uniref:Anti-sigma n=2 Tax=Novosphingobium resinovorum TaxID=158500 RepID=A0A031JXI3_9SPHN|nr:Anti-sigma [Novosphingobium resinovorum]